MTADVKAWFRRAGWRLVTYRGQLAYQRGGSLIFLDVEDYFHNQDPAMSEAWKRMAIDEMTHHWKMRTG